MTRIVVLPGRFALGLFRVALVRAGLAATLAGAFAAAFTALPAAALDRPAARDAAPASVSITPALLGVASPAGVPVTPEVFRSSPSRPDRSIEAIAGRISYAGALLLTADQLFRSFDSVLERARIEGADGACLRLDVKECPGVGIMLLLSRPLERAPR